METKKLLYIAGGVILLGVVVYSVWVNLNKTNQQSVPAFPTSSAAATANTAGGANKSSLKTPLSATKAYLDAIKVYKSVGYYFQFVSCHGLPGTLTLKTGRKFMLDNRDGVAHKIAVKGSQSFNIGAYGFAVATAPSTIGTNYITCDGGGAATITVQK